jgi:geranylgeranyl pyrophosphate synthase
MSYACLDGGKRFRAMLVFACGELAGADTGLLDTPAAAVEMVHAYSLVHDDLPAMDDDDMRRGCPACHIKFDEATAILAGDALQARALELVASERWNPVTATQRASMVEALARAIGSCGMVGGQALDMDASGREIGFEDLVRLHQLKTGALIEASAVLGGLASSVADDGLNKTLREYASCIGLAFQVTDDILDCTVDSETLGKESGADNRMLKSTYVTILGLDEARREAARLSERAIETIRCLGDNRELLEQLARFVVDRNY